MKDDKSCLDKIRKIVSKLGHNPRSGIDRIKAQAPVRDIKDIMGIYPSAVNKPYDIKDIIHCLADKDSVVEYKEDYGKTIFVVMPELTDGRLALWQTNDW